MDEFKIELDKFQTLGAPLSPTSGGSNGNGSYSFSSYGTVSRQISNYGEIGADFKNEQGKIDEQLKKLEEESREYWRGWITNFILGKNF